MADNADLARRLHEAWNERNFDEGAEATAPLARAVIGGLAAATLATLVVLPSVYSLVQQSAGVRSPSLDPDDPDGRFRIPADEL